VLCSAAEGEECLRSLLNSQGEKGWKKVVGGIYGGKDGGPGIPFPWIANFIKVQH